MESLSVQTEKQNISPADTIKQLPNFRKNVRLKHMTALPLNCLKDMYRYSDCPDPMDLQGEFKGLILPNTALPQLIQANSKPWSSRKFYPAEVGPNMVRSGKLALQYFIGPSLNDKKSALVIDYSQDNIPTRLQALREEIRMYSENLFIGRVHFAGRGLFYFALERV